MSLTPLPTVPPLPAVANTNTAHLNPLPQSVFTLPQTAQLEALYTIIRDKDTPRGDFLFYSDRIIRLLVEEGLNHLPVVSRTVETPTDEETALPKLFYSKFPSDIASRYVLLLDPMLGTIIYLYRVQSFELLAATGGSAMKAVEVLMEHGVPEERIIFINLIASPEGLITFCGRYPQLKVITGWIDEGLNEKAYIIPGLGDFVVR
ncbi:hypothetical protein H0H87_001865 [Tephrocybe sp. NHM501043]|nr:hypothetical protein H0H87_001865 [Tephrocybe sp. NHM501043]